MTENNRYVKFVVVNCAIKVQNEIKVETTLELSALDILKHVFVTIHVLSERLQQITCSY